MPSDVESAPGEGEKGKKPPRFELELEFVQCLANPTYIHYLAQNRYFEDEAFIGYLKYQSRLLISFLCYIKNGWAS